MAATSIWLAAAVLTQIAIAFVLLWILGAIRVPLVAGGRIPMADIALSHEPWPEHEKRVSNAFDNQFQLPVLFYVLTILAMITRHADFLFVVMAWLFVLTRLAHAFVHTGSNYIRYRFNAFALGFLILLIMWIIFAVRILLGLP